jgi:elongation factor G
VWDGNKVNFLDTPGYDDFLNETVCALRVVESAVILVAAPSGVDVGTERSWTLCKAQQLPRMFLVNKMDRENASFSRCVSEIHHAFGTKCVPFQLPIGSAQDFQGVVSLIHPPAQLPEEVAAEFGPARERLIEAIAEADDALADKYLEGAEITEEELVAGARSAILRGELFPILASSATQNVGVAEFLGMVQEFMPSPVDGQKPMLLDSSTQNEIDFAVDPDGPLAAFVFKTTADPFVGKLSLFRVYRGTIRSNTEVWNSGRRQSERIGQLYLPRGKSQENVAEVVAGDIGAIGKLASTMTGDTLCLRDRAVAFQPIQFPVGYYTVAVYPAGKADLDKMSLALTRIVEEDPSLRFFRDPTTNESLISGLGEAQTDVALEKIRRKFGADLKARLPKVAYKETISRVTQTEYRHKKQSGGHGQYGHVMLRLEPLERNQGFEFASEVVGGAVPREYLPAVEKGVTKAMEEGALAGFPLVDLRAVIYDGSYHEVDSSGISFEIAGNQALRKGVAEARPIILEPIMKLTATVPDAYNGEVISDLNGRRGRILGMTPQAGVTVIEAEVPQAEVQRYSQDLRSLTQGRGTFKVEFDHYEPAPPNIEQRVIQETRRAREAEKV